MRAVQRWARKNADGNAQGLRSSDADRRLRRRAVAAPMDAKWAAKKKRSLLEVCRQRRLRERGTSSVNWHRVLRRESPKRVLRRSAGSTICRRSKKTPTGFPRSLNDSKRLSLDRMWCDCCSNDIWRLSCRGEVRSADRWRGTVVRGARRHRYRPYAATFHTRTPESEPAKIVADRKLELDNAGCAA